MPASESDAGVPDWLARIRQKASGDQPAGGGLFSDEEGDEAPDWLKGLGGGERDDAATGLGEETAASETTGFGSDDWLSRLGDEPAAPAAPSGTAQPAAKEDAVDLSGWLAGLDAQDAASAEPAPEEPTQPGRALEGWGSSLFVDESVPPAAVQPPASFGPEDSGDDWLSKLSLDAEAPAPEPPAATQSASWDSSLWADPAPGKPAEAGTPPAADDNFDWLRSFQAQDAAPAEPESAPAVPETPSGSSASSGWGLTGWLGQPAAAQEPDAAEPAAETPDWLASLNGPSAAGGEALFANEAPVEQEQPEPAADSGIPAWLLDETPSAGEQTPAAPAGDLPSWMAQEPPAPAEPAPSAEESSTIPTWLADSEPAQAPAEPAPASSIPDWLAGLKAEPPQDGVTVPESTGSVPEAAAEGEGLPAWLKDDFGVQATQPAPRGEAQDDQLPGWISAGEPAAAPTTQPSADLPEDFAFNLFRAPDEPEAVKPAAEETAGTQPAPETQPDWLASLKAAGEESAFIEEPQPEPGKGAGLLPFIDQGLPDWMNEFQGQAPADATVPPLIQAEETASTYTGKEAPFDIELPAWLDEEAAHRSAEQNKQAEAGDAASEGLAEAELPSWVAAMRPVETAIKGDLALVDSDQNVEKSGPLSGMRGVLPSDESVTSYRKPPIYSIKLRVSEKQRGHSTLLESLVGQEIQPLVLPPVKSQAPQIVLRVLLALFMLVVLAGALLINWQMPTPALIPPDTLDMFAQVEALPADQTVLLAVDFEPGLSGEMRFASTTVIDHLMARGAQIAVVSTVTVGPAMADALLKQVQQGRPEYDLAAKVVNLGYLPGGTISLVEFARNPHGAAPQTTGGEAAWDKPVLTGIDDIQKFSSVIVLTDRAETGRDWVEQVQPYLGNVPLLFVSSAQAAPLLEPYVESRQVQGLVSGLLGGTLYGQQTGRQAVNPAMGHYGAYQVGVLLAFVLVLFGAIVSSITSLVTRNKKNRE